MRSLIFTFLFCMVFAVGLNAQNEFITEWKVEDPWGNGDTSIQFPGIGSNYTIAWEQVGNPSNSGVITNAQSGQQIQLHAEGNYLLKVSAGAGTFTSFDVQQFYNSIDNLLFVRQWGNTQWTTMEGAFWGCSNLDVTASDVPNLSLVKSTKNMFEGCGLLKGNSSFNNWDVSSVEDMSNMFYACREFNQNINNWNTSNVTNFSFMFNFAEAFNQPLNNWNTAKVTDMSYMFYGASNFNQNIDSWNTANVTNMKSMFTSAIAFNQPLNSWDMSKVTDISSMFNLATSFNQPLNSWNTQSVTNMNSTFSLTEAFNQNINSWNTSNVTSMAGTFSSTPSFDQPLNNWNTGKVTNMQSMFSQSIFNQDISSWNTASVTNMSYMFMENTVFNQSLNNWNTSNVINMSGMFRDATSFDGAIGNWNTSKVRDMSHMFNNATAFNQDISQWYRTAGILRDMSFMFNNATAFNQPIGNWNTMTVWNMARVLNNATSFNQPLKWTIESLNFNTSIGLSNSGLDCVNYSNTLKNWANIFRYELILDAVGLNYNAEGQAARNTLINDRRWVINGDAFDVNCGTLPVNILSFELEKQKDGILIKWTTANEINNKGFVVERSNDSKLFEELQFVSAKTEAGDYSFKDVNPINGKNYYRLKQIDLDGTVSLHEVKFIDFNSSVSELTLYPNPVTNGILHVRHENNAEITIVNSIGQTVRRVSTSGNFTTINVSNLAKGIYFMRVNDRTLKFIIQ